MSTAIRTILMVVLFSYIMNLEINLDSDKTSTRQMKNNLEIAVHDAALAVSSTDLVQGNIVFDQNAAINNLQKSLETNLNLTSMDGYVYKPNENSFFKNELEIVELKFIDDNVTTTYPYVYTDSAYDVVETVYGPSVIAVITTESPHWFVGNSTTLIQAAVYEYKK